MKRLLIRGSYVTLMIIGMIAAAIVGLQYGQSQGYTQGYTQGYIQGCHDTYQQAQDKIQAETDYYMKACEMGGDADWMTLEQAVRWLRYVQWTHQAWYDNPQWYDFEPNRRANEKTLVRVYGRLIELVGRED